MEENGEVLDWKDAKREELLDVFRGELGAGRPEHYWSIVGPSFVGKHWCGGMCLWAMREVGLAPGVMWENDAARERYGFCFRLGAPIPKLADAKPGDVCYFLNKQHHALFVRIDGKTLVTLDGNQLAPERVRVCRRPLASVAAIYSIERFLDDALAAENAKRMGQ
jgi:hypothetical protein